MICEICRAPVSEFAPFARCPAHPLIVDGVIPAELPPHCDAAVGKVATARGPMRSHRSTTISRYPGRVFEGDVMRGTVELRLCSDCGRPRLVVAGIEPGPHAVVQRLEGLRDCMQRSVIPKAGAA